MADDMQSPVEVLVRPAEPRDAESIHRLVLELARFEQLEDQVVATARDLEQLLFGEAAAGEALLAEVDSEVAGMALFFTTFSSFLGQPGIHLEDLFVLPRFRRRGVATRLMAALGEICAARGSGRLEWSVLDWNEEAQTFYRGLEAGPVEGWTVFRLTGGALRRLADRHLSG